MIVAPDSPRRPPVRWHGSKWRMAHWILSFLPAHKTYVEPFGGGAAVLLRKPRSTHEIYNDLDKDLVHLFSVLRSEDLGPKLFAQLELTPYALEEFRAAHAPATDPVERARRFLVLSHQGVGGDAARGRCDGFKRGKRANTDYSCSWAKLPAALASTAERLRGVQIERQDATRVIARFDGHGTLFLVDPPYMPETRRRPDHGYSVEMDAPGHKVLLTQLKQVAGMVALCGYRCELYDCELAQWTRYDYSTRDAGAKLRVESLWLNPAAVAAREASA